MASVVDGFCDICLTDLDEYMPAAPSPRPTSSRPERRALETDEDMWFSEAWFS
jgi:hypothetical protein